MSGRKRKVGFNSLYSRSYMLLLSFRENYACGCGGVAYSGGDMAAEMRVNLIPKKSLLS